MSSLIGDKWCAGLMCPSDKEREERENGGPSGSSKPGISVCILYFLKKF